jgi:hypothetical protein
MNINTVKFLHVNVDEISVPHWLDVSTSFPALLLLPADETKLEGPFRFFSGSGQVLPIMKWIQQNAALPFELPKLAQFDKADRELYKEQLSQLHLTRSRTKEMELSAFA